jgi:protein SCO1/2
MVNKKSQKSNIKLYLIILLDMLLIVVLIIYFGLIRPHVAIKVNGTYIMNPTDIAQFRLIDQDGGIVSKEQLKGRWTMVFFGFTNCPMICPTTMAILNQMYKKLEVDLPENKLPQVILISVDPNRDTVKQLNRFVHQFNPQFIGARADREEIIALEKQLHLTVTEDNLMNHSMEILLLNPDVRVQVYFSYPQNASQLSIDYKNIITVH